MTQPKSDLTSTAGQVRAGAGSEAPPAQAPPAASLDSDAEEDFSDDDPLSAFIEEVDVATEEQPAEAVSAAPSEVAAPASDDTDEDDQQELIAEPPVEEPLGNGGPKRTQEKQAEPKQQVIVESGPRRSGKPSNLSFGKGRPEQQQADNKGPRQEKPAPKQRAEQHQQPAPKSEARQPEPTKEAQRAPDQQRQAQPQKMQEQPQKKQEQRARNDRAPQHQKPQQQQKQQEARPAMRQPAKHEGAKVTGRLCGWLVSYDTPEGSAVELREGEFFVTSTSLKTSDLIIDDPSVSTPHAMVKISAESGMVVQDLLSDNGVHVKRRGSGNFEQINESAVCDHGDLVRFGNIEFLVSLVAHIGMK